MRRLSATTARVPPGPSSLARVVNRCARRTSKSFMTGQVRGDPRHEQPCPTTCFQETRWISPSTGFSVVTEVQLQPLPVVGEDLQFAFRHQQSCEGDCRDRMCSFRSLMGGTQCIGETSASFPKGRQSITVLAYGTRPTVYEGRSFRNHLAPQGVDRASVVHGTLAPR